MILIVDVDKNAFEVSKSCEDILSREKSWILDRGTYIDGVLKSKEK